MKEAQPLVLQYRLCCRARANHGGLGRGHMLGAGQGSLSLVLSLQKIKWIETFPQELEEVAKTKTNKKLGALDLMNLDIGSLADVSGRAHASVHSPLSLHCASPRPIAGNDLSSQTAALEGFESTSTFQRCGGGGACFLWCQYE